MLIIFSLFVLQQSYFEMYSLATKTSRLKVRKFSLYDFKLKFIKTKIFLFFLLMKIKKVKKNYEIKRRSLNCQRKLYFSKLFFIVEKLIQLRNVISCFFPSLILMNRKNSIQLLKTECSFFVPSTQETKPSSIWFGRKLKFSFKSNFFLEKYLFLEIRMKTKI